MTSKTSSPSSAVVRGRTGRTISESLGQVSATDAMSALTQLVGFVQESVRLHESESTKREQLRTYRETEVARVHASERVIREYLDLTLKERRETHRELFTRLDTAIETGDTAAMQTLVSGIVEIARVSPLNGIANLGDLLRAMADPNAVFEL